MAGRNYLPPKTLKLREVPFTRAPHPALIDDPRFPVHPPPAAALAEELIAAQHHEIQSLLIDNQRLAATHVALKQEFSAAQQELRHLSTAAAAVKAERNAQVRAVHERSLKMEAEVHSINALSAELARVRADVQKLTASRQELTVKLKAIDDDRVRALSESKQFPSCEQI